MDYIYVGVIWKQYGQWWLCWQITSCEITHIIIG